MECKASTKEITIIEKTSISSLEVNDDVALKAKDNYAAGDTEDTYTDLASTRSQ